MKKVLALVMVLGMAGLASAGLQITVNSTVAGDQITVLTGTQLMIGIGNEQGADQYNAALILSGMGQWGEAKLNRPLPLADGWVAYGFQPDFGGDVMYGFFAQPVTDKLPAGIIGEVAYTCTGVGQATIVLTDGDLNPIGSLTINQIVPEPMTLSLLGLGALVLRRKK